MSLDVLGSELAASSATETTIPHLKLIPISDDESVTDVEKGSLSQGEITPTKIEGDETESLLVDFDGPDDLSNPINWSKRYKWFIVVLLSLVNLIA